MSGEGVSDEGVSGEGTWMSCEGVRLVRGCEW